jgi:hypothetical protein
VKGSCPLVAVRAIAPMTPPFADGGLPARAPRTAPAAWVVLEVEPVVVVEPVVLVDVLVEVEPVVDVDVDPVVDVDVEVLVVVVPVVVVDVELVVVVLVVDGVVVVVVVVLVTHRLASWLCGPGVEGPRRMSPACLL